jgi:hypothetical protein
MAEFLSSLDQKDMLRRSLGNPATGDVPDDSLMQYLWLAECDLAEMYEFSELRDSEDITTSAGTYDYEMTEPDILRFLTPANNVTSDIEMKLMDADWDRKVGSNLVGQGTPFFWFENGVGSNNRKQIRVRPTPSGVFTVRVAFIKIPTMMDATEPTRSDIPVSHTLQVISRATEIGLQLQGERSEADAQADLSAKTNYASRHALPKAAFYTNRLMSFQQRMNLNRGSRRG